MRNKMENKMETRKMPRTASGDFVRTRALNASAEYPRINKHNNETQGNEWDMAALLRE
jgi:hypothetical protein